MAAETGRLHQIHRGVYLVGHPEPPPRGREMAAQLACAPKALLSHRSAARLWKLLPHAERLPPVDVTVVARDVRSQRGISVHQVASFAHRDAVRQRRLWLTRPARTLLDLAAVLDDGELERVIAEARRRNLVTEAAINDQLVGNRGRRGAGRLRKVLELERGPAFTRSKAERLMLALVRTGGLPVPETNVAIASFEVDFLWREEKCVFDVDGAAWHSDRLAFETDRRRDAELTALGFVVIRVTWRQLTRESGQVTARLERVLASRPRPG